MKGCSVRVMTVFIIIFAILNPFAMSSRNIATEGDGRRGEEMNAEAVVESVRVVAGSRLPDCSHACGSCSPCRLVMVSFVCATIAEAETCPMAYKCMCRRKSFPIP